MAAEKPGNYFEEKALWERKRLRAADGIAAALLTSRHELSRKRLPPQIQAAIAHKISVSGDQLRDFKRMKKKNKPRR